MGVQRGYGRQSKKSVDGQAGRCQTSRKLDLNGVSNITSTLLIIEWTQIDNGMESRCITGYRLTWNGGMYSTSATFASSRDLASAGFPYCQSVLVTVSPVTPVELVTGGSGNVTAMLQHPDFPEPQVSAYFARQSGESFIMTIQWQEGLSSDEVPVRMYGYSVPGAECTPDNMVGSSKSSVTFSVPGAEPGNTFNYCVLFQNNQCMAIRNRSVSVGNPTLNVKEVKPADASSTITVTLLPLPSTYTESDLQIRSSIEPPDAPEIVADYPTGSQQYTVEFTGLRPDTMYTFTVRVALRNDNYATVGLSIVGVFTITACGVSCIAGTIVGVVLIGLAVGGVATATVIIVKKKKATDQTRRTQD